MANKIFSRSFTQQEPICQEAIDAAIGVLESGRLHRYNVVAGETSQVSQFELDFANYQGTKYCLACSSGGYALSITLKAAGLESGESVLTNMYTLAPVPGAISNAGGAAIFVETNEELVIDLNDLEKKIASSGSRFLLLSHMRGHIVDMNKLMQIVDNNNLILIEDCAHTMGAKWNKHRSGNFGLAGCFSTQTYKHINSGEGGIITTDDPELMARAIVMSGSYMLYDRHEASPDVKIFEELRLETPNYSGRMDNLRAAILRPQLGQLDINIDRWNRRYRAIEEVLSEVDGVALPSRSKKEHYVGSSIQFRLPGISGRDAIKFIDTNQNHGVEIKWFGDDNPNGYTSNHKSWKYIDSQNLDSSDEILSSLFDLRLPLTFSIQDCILIAEVISDSVKEVLH